MRNVYLNIADKRYSGWEEVSIFDSMESLAAQFDVDYSEQHNFFSELSIQLGDRIQVTDGDDLIVTGHIEDLTPEYDDATHSLKAAGRSALGDLVDCGLDENDQFNRQFKNQALDAIARQLCKPFGIDVVVDLGVNLGAPFTASIDEGQSIFSFLDELCRYRGIRLLGDEQGRLVLTKPGAQKSTSKLELGVNIKAARASFSVRNVFSAYTVLAQLTDPTGLFSANAVARQKGREVEALLSRHRPFVSVSDQQANNKECLKRAQFEQRTRSGRAQGVTYTVVGWRDDQDQLWRKNTLLPIYDPYMGIDGEWLITSVRYILGAQGKQAELTVMPLSAFDIQIPVEKRPINFFKKLDN